MFPAAKDLHTAAPLSIATDTKLDEIASYKAPWNAPDASAALSSTGLYEAGGNALWLATNLALSSAIPTDIPTVRTVLRYKELYFGRDAMWNSKLCSSRGSRNRLIWPFSMECFALEATSVIHDHFKNTLQLVGGYPILWAWYAALQDAIEKRDQEMLTRLWECGLTVTLQARTSFITFCILFY